MRYFELGILGHALDDCLSYPRILLQVVLPATLIALVNVLEPRVLILLVWLFAFFSRSWGVTQI